MKRIVAISCLLAFAFSSGAIGRGTYEDGKRDGYNKGYNAGVNHEAVEKEKTRRARLKKLEDCLRKADWPGMPSRSECQALYGE